MTAYSVGSVNQYLTRAEQAGIGWPLPVEMDLAALVKALFPDQPVTHRKGFIVPDWSSVQNELRYKGVTKQLLWEEYCQRHPHSAYSYSQYCHHYQVRLSQQRRSMRQVHKAGEKLFIDYAGPMVPVVNPDTGEIRQAAIFVAVLGASNYSFAEATWGQSLSDWLESHVRAFEFFGGTTTILVPDNLKSAINKACRYEPEMNRSYGMLAAHYSVAAIPARPRKPKDKSKAEGGVLLIEYDAHFYSVPHQLSGQLEVHVS
ncbi:MAG: IS21 family transposase [bacterium]